MNVPPSNIPIVGQPYTPRGGFATAVITCNCATPADVLLVGQTPNTCRNCGRMFTLGAATFDHASGEMRLSVGMATAPAISQ